MANIGETFNQKSVKDAFEYMKTENGYKYHATDVDSAFESVYSGKSGNKQEYGTRFLVKYFKSASEWIIGENVLNHNVSVMDLKKMFLSGGDKFDNETIKDREKYLKSLTEVYLSQYVYIRTLINYECGKCAKKWVAEYTKGMEELPADVWEKYSDNKDWFKEVDAKIRKVEEGINNEKLETLDKKYSNRIKNAQEDLLTIDNLYKKALQQINAEFKGLEYESKNKDTYVLGNQAFKIGKVNSDDYDAIISDKANSNSTLENISKTVGNFNVKFQDHNCFKGHKLWFWNLIKYNNKLKAEVKDVKMDLKQVMNMYKPSDCNNKRKASSNAKYLIQMGLGYEKYCHANNWVEQWIKTFNSNFWNQKEEREITKKADGITAIDRPTLGKLFKAYTRVDGKMGIAGILVADGDKKVAVKEKMKRSFYYAQRESYENVEAIKTCTLESTLRYITNPEETKGVTVTQKRLLDFEKGTNTIVDRNSNKQLGVVQDASADFFKALDVIKDMAKNI